MGNRIIKYVIFCGVLLFVNSGFGQGNPGFIGKKIAIGYSSQYSLVRSEQLFDPNPNVSTARVLTNNDFYVEYSIGKYKSVAAHLTYQKVPFVINSYSYDEANIGQEFTLNGSTYMAKFVKTGGYAEFSMVGLGLKYTLFSSKKTIASPIGIGHYFRFDIFSNKALNNNFKYTTGYSYSGDLTEKQKEYAQNNLNRKVSGSRVLNASIGYGIESKFPVTRSIYFRLNGEFNFSLNILKQLNDNSTYSSEEYSTVSEDMDKVSRSVNDYRNMFLLGMGVGLLL